MSDNEINEPRRDPERPPEPQDEPETAPPEEVESGGTDGPHEGPAPEPGRPRRLLRSRRDRMIAGVAGGLGEYFGVDPVIVRIAFAVSVFFGGLGALLYIALALFVPMAPAAAGEEVVPAPVERSRGLAIAAGAALLVIALSWGVFDFGHGFFFGWGPFWLGPPLFLIAAVALVVWVVRGASGVGPASVLGRIALAIAALIAVSILVLASAWAGATGHGVIIAALVIAIGGLLLAAAFRGGARWLVIPALALAAPLGVVAAADISFGDGIGEREYRPTTVASLPENGYELGVGRLVVDLRELDWRPRSVVDVDVDLGVGQAVVAVPSSVCVTAEADSRAGSLRIAGEEQNGLDVDSDTNLGSSSTPRLDLTAQVDLGEHLVVNDDDADLGPGHGRFDGPSGFDDATMRQDLDRACAIGSPPSNAPGHAGGDGNGEAPRSQGPRQRGGAENGG